MAPLANTSQFASNEMKSNSTTTTSQLFLSLLLVLLILVSNLLAALLRSYRRSLALASLSTLNILNAALMELVNLWTTANNLVLLYRLDISVLSFVQFQLMLVVFHTLPCALCGLSMASSVLRLLYVTKFSQVHKHTTLYTLFCDLT
jgi:hypothetical protein